MRKVRGKGQGHGKGKGKREGMSLKFQNRGAFK